MLKKDELPECPVATAVNLIGNKWKLLILQQLLERTYRFGELKKSVSGISQKVLTENLRALEDDGLVLRTVYPEVPPRVEYSVTELGSSLQPVFDRLIEWGFHYKDSMK